MDGRFVAKEKGHLRGRRQAEGRGTVSTGTGAGDMVAGW